MRLVDFTRFRDGLLVDMCIQSKDVTRGVLDLITIGSHSNNYTEYVIFRNVLVSGKGIK